MAANQADKSVFGMPVSYTAWLSLAIAIRRDCALDTLGNENP